MLMPNLKVSYSASNILIIGLDLKVVSAPCPISQYHDGRVSNVGVNSGNPFLQTVGVSLQTEEAIPRYPIIEVQRTMESDFQEMFAVNPPQQEIYHTGPGGNQGAVQPGNLLQSPAQPWYFGQNQMAPQISASLQYGPFNQLQIPNVDQSIIISQHPEQKDDQPKNVQQPGPWQANAYPGRIPTQIAASPMVPRLHYNPMAIRSSGLNSFAAQNSFLGNGSQNYSLPFSTSVGSPLRLPQINPPLIRQNGPFGPVGLGSPYLQGFNRAAAFATPDRSILAGVGAQFGSTGRRFGPPFVPTMIPGAVSFGPRFGGPLRFPF